MSINCGFILQSHQHPPCAKKYLMAAAFCHYILPGAWKSFKQLLAVPYIIYMVLDLCRCMVYIIHTVIYSGYGWISIPWWSNQFFAWASRLTATLKRATISSILLSLLHLEKPRGWRMKMYKTKSNSIALKCLWHGTIRLHTYIPSSKVQIINDCLRSNIVLSMHTQHRNL